VWKVWWQKFLRGPFQVDAGRGMLETGQKGRRGERSRRESEPSHATLNGVRVKKLDGDEEKRASSSGGGSETDRTGRVRGQGRDLIAVAEHWSNEQDLTEWQARVKMVDGVMRRGLRILSDNFFLNRFSVFFE